MKLALLAVALLGYVLPGHVALDQVARQAGFRGPLRVQATLAGIGESWPERVYMEIDAARGVRVWDDAGNRWLVLRDRVVAGSVAAPPWIPELEVLTLRSQAELLEFSFRSGVDAQRNALRRCAERDCFAIGGWGAGQLWVDKSDFSVRALLLPGGRRIEFSAPRVWGSGRRAPRFPELIRIFDEFGEIGSLRVQVAGPAPASEPEDWTDRWVSPPAPID